MNRLKIRYILVLALLGPQLALAAPASVGSNQIHVSGVVPDRRVIVLGSKLEVEQIFSNTDKDVIPTVRVGWIGGTELPLTQVVAKQYDGLFSQLKTNKVVSITRIDSDNLPTVYPDFTELATAQTYSVKPTAMPDDTVAAAYLIQL